MQKKIIVFVCAVLGVVLALSVASAVYNRSEYRRKEEKIEPMVKRFIDVFNNVDKPEYKSEYWELLSQRSKDVLIEQSGSEEAAQRQVWIMLQEVVEQGKQVEYLGIEHYEITGDTVTVVVRVRITDVEGQSTETTALHKYRWEENQWKFIDWNLEPEMYKR
ncbi:MAG: hypothetical protein PVF58_00750 [Candidatus Methanofastidiosia archaeon]|jgi:hypothetical protein